MKKIGLIAILIILTISLAACSAAGKKTDNIYSKIHDLYYDIASYTADCSVCAYTMAGETKYDCRMSYFKDDDSYTMAYDDITIKINGDKTVITKGDNTIETLSSNEDMYIFINSFFKSYYESEDTSLSVSAAKGADATLLECSVLNPTDYLSKMKLWVDSETAAPKKMQIFSGDGKIHTEVVFKNFTFNL